MAKILISLLGTGRIAKGDRSKNMYETTDYKLEDKIYKQKTMVSSAIIEHYKIDTLFLVGTSTSMWDNVCSLYGSDDEYTLSIMEKKEAGILKESDLEQLSQDINKKLNSQNSKCFIVKDCETQEELWNMFDKFLEILSTIGKEDEVYFDITHLFRSVSVLSMIMAEFGKISFDMKVSGVFYGLFKKDEPSVVVDLSVFLELLDWIRAIANLKNYGNSFELMKLINSSHQDKEIKNSFTNFSNALSMSDMGAMQQNIKILKGKMKLFENDKSNIIRLISKDLQEFIERFSIDSLADFQYELAKWYCENKNYAFGYITLSEAIVSKMCEIYNLDPTLQDNRTQAKSMLYEYRKNFSKQKKEIGDTYDKVRRIRNDIAHKKPQESKESKSSPKNSIENLELYIKKAAALFNMEKELSM